MYLPRYKKIMTSWNVFYHLIVQLCNKKMGGTSHVCNLFKKYNISAFFLQKNMMP